MKQEKQKWLILEDDGWQIIIPNFDSKPHSSEVSNKKSKPLSYSDCPCKPTINLTSQIITHNSFIDMEKVDEAIKKFSTG